MPHLLAGEPMVVLLAPILKLTKRHPQQNTGIFNNTVSFPPRDPHASVFNPILPQIRPRRAAAKEAKILPPATASPYAHFQSRKYPAPAGTIHTENAINPLFFVYPGPPDPFARKGKRSPDLPSNSTDPLKGSRRVRTKAAEVQ